jgi:two-component system, chemotaxis family, CheB/CheR fusion protein
MRILIVDDDLDSAASLAALLAATGHDVRVEAGARAGADAAANWKADVALLDIGLPHGGAYLVARRVRAEPDTRPTRLVALTEWGQQQDRRRLAEAGFDHHLVKPVDPLHLRVLLNSVASGSHAIEGSAPKD